jgi:hypothetical protein
MNITDEDREAVDTLAHQICNCCTTLQHKVDMAALIAYGEACYRKGVDDAARLCENECDEVRFEDRNAIARRIRKLGEG